MCQNGQVSQLFDLSEAIVSIAETIDADQLFTLDCVVGLKNKIRTC